MFKGLTQRAQKVLTILAQEEAKRFHSDQLLPEHIILALLKDGEGWRSRRCSGSRWTSSEMQAEIEKSLPKGKGGLILGDVPPSKRGPEDPGGLRGGGPQHGPRVHRHRAPAAGRREGAGKHRRPATSPGTTSPPTGCGRRSCRSAAPGTTRARPAQAGKKKPAAPTKKPTPDAGRVRPRPHRVRPGRQAGPGDRPGEGDPARHPDPRAPHQEQSRAHRRAGRRQDGHRGGPGAEDRGRHACPRCSSASACSPSTSPPSWPARSTAASSRSASSAS